MLRRICLVLLAVAFSTLTASAQDSDQWITFQPKGDGPGKGKHVVLVSGDEEYRSEEALPQLAKILSQRHGFTCTVLFALDKDGVINPNVNNNIPGLENLKKADLMIIATRFRNLPDDQMKHIDDYVQTGKPIIGLRTATHAFSLGSKTYAKYHWQAKGEWKGGFGKHLLGETWVAHHGHHGKEAARGILAPGADKSPLCNGIKDGDIFGPSDVYTAYPPKDATILVLGQVVAGMKKDDPPVAGKKNDPMMPVAWTRTLKSEQGAGQKIFTTTMGASQDLESAGLRRLLVNACCWCLDLPIPPSANVDLVGEYKARPFRNDGFEKNKRPADYK